MKKVTKFIAVLLAALTLMTSFAFAAESKQEPYPGKKSGKTNEYVYKEDGSCTLIGVNKKYYNRKVKGVPQNPGINGYKFTVTAIAKNAFAKLKKVKVIKFNFTKAPKVAKGAFGKLNTKKITIKVSNKMSKKEFKKFSTRLKKAGFKGKIKRVKL